MIRNTNIAQGLPYEIEKVESKDRLLRGVHIFKLKDCCSFSPPGAAIMGRLHSSAILPLFLDSRRALIRSHLRLSRGVSLSLDTASLAALLAQLVRVIQVSLCQTGELFLEASSSRAPLLFSTLLAVTPATQLFGGIPQPEKELELWKEQREGLEARVTPLSGRAVTEAALRWLQVRRRTKSRY